ncbi:hypothetical protein EYC80_008541 [Monilinia laxa]|uniref:Uncharacterized protein n=1 Tax=Monilinia laxa TaxID=61186 RepID=A0A5N6JTF4_MONLA|nr:hypothetical protein EYC80_008541 [Monilinia laxa]
MAPHLAESKATLIIGIFSGRLFTNSEIVEVANCIACGMRRIWTMLSHIISIRYSRSCANLYAVAPRSVTKVMIHSLE